MPSHPAKPSGTPDHLRLVTPPQLPPAPIRPVLVPPVLATGAMAVPTTAAAAGRTAVSAARKAKPLGDWLLHGLGVGAATASAGFATYAMIFSTGEVVPSGNFNLFARYDRLYQAPTIRTGPSGPAVPADPVAGAPSADRTETASRDAVDFTPTGSLGAASDAVPTARATASQATSGANRPLPGFTLRDVFDGKALVESRSSLSVVKPGSVIEGAGEVLAIEKRGERWEVRTANGVIAGRRS